MTIVNGQFVFSAQDVSALDPAVQKSLQFLASERRVSVESLLSERVNRVVIGASSQEVRAAVNREVRDAINADPDAFLVSVKDFNSSVVKAGAASLKK